MIRTNIKTTNIELTNDIRDYLEKRLVAFEKLTAHHEEAAIIDVELGRTSRHQTGDVYRAEINVHIGKKGFRAVREAGDLFASIDEAKDQMMDELRSDKERSLSLIRKGGQRVKNFVKGFPWIRRKR